MTIRPSRKRVRMEMPASIEQRLRKEGLMSAHRPRPAYQQNDRLGWILRAKRPETRARRLNQMLEELRVGNAHMKMPYRPKAE